MVWMGCGAHAFTLSGQTTTSAGPHTEVASAESAGTGASGAPPYFDDDEDAFGQAYGPRGAVRGDGWYVESDHRWTILAGYSVEEATRRAKAAGFTGRIEIRERTRYQAGCELGAVCWVTPRRWELDQDRVMTLWVNKALEISAPE